MVRVYQRNKGLEHGNGLLGGCFMRSRYAERVCLHLRFFQLHEIQHTCCPPCSWQHPGYPNKQHEVHRFAVTANNIAAPPFEVVVQPQADEDDSGEERCTPQRGKHLFLHFRADDGVGFRPSGHLGSWSVAGLSLVLRKACGGDPGL